MHMPFHNNYWLCYRYLEHEIEHSYITPTQHKYDDDLLRPHTQLTQLDIIRLHNISCILHLNNTIQILRLKIICWKSCRIIYWGQVMRVLGWRMDWDWSCWFILISLQSSASLCRAQGRRHPLGMSRTGGVGGHCWMELVLTEHEDLNMEQMTI